MTAGLLLVPTCTDTSPPTAPLPSAEIVDGAHGTGNPHFYWLPPITSYPMPTGVFDPSLSPVVEICEWDGTRCSGPPVATFTMSDGGSAGIRVVLEDEAYVVQWNTRGVGLVTPSTYRVFARLGALELGHADVRVVGTARDLARIDRTSYVPLMNGKTLPIKFRLEVNVAPPASLTNARWTNVTGTDLFGAYVLDIIQGRVDCAGSPLCAGRVVYVRVRNSTTNEALGDVTAEFGGDGLQASFTFRVPQTGSPGMIFNASLDDFEIGAVVSSRGVAVIRAPLLSNPRWTDGDGAAVADVSPGSTAYATIDCNASAVDACAGFPIAFEFVNNGAGGILGFGSGALPTVAIPGSGFLSRTEAVFPSAGPAAVPLTIPADAPGLWFTASLADLPIVASPVLIVDPTAPFLARPRWTNDIGSHVFGGFVGNTVYARVDCGTTSAVCASLPVFFRIENSATGDLIADQIVTFSSDGSAATLAFTLTETARPGLRLIASLRGFGVEPLILTAIAVQ